jgi:hypothetical protein
MKIAIFIPVKKYTESKERLSNILTNSERAVLAKTMAQKTVNAFVQANIASTITVVTNDPHLVIQGAEIFVSTLSLNLALEEAIANTMPFGKIMITHADLPRINASDIELLCMNLFESSLKFKLYFGPNSFHLFQQAFKEHVFTFESPSITSLQQDLDSDDDYFKLIKYVEV